MMLNARKYCIQHWKNGDCQPFSSLHQFWTVLLFCLHILDLSDSAIHPFTLLARLNQNANYNTKILIWFFLRPQIQQFVKEIIQIGYEGRFFAKSLHILSAPYFHLKTHFGVLMKFSFVGVITQFVWMIRNNNVLNFDGKCSSSQVEIFSMVTLWHLSFAHKDFKQKNTR